MYHLSKFDSKDGKPDIEQIENWVDGYFYSLMNILNGFFSKVDVAEAYSRLIKVPFEDVMLEQLEGESEEIIQIATKKLKELVELELEFYKSYTQ